MSNQVPLMKVYNHQVYEFIIVRFDNKGEFEPLMQFTFPYFDQQRIYFNEHYDRMIVYSIGNRVFLYKRIQISAFTKDLNDIPVAKW